MPFVVYICIWIYMDEQQERIPIRAKVREIVVFFYEKEVDLYL